MIDGSEKRNRQLAFELQNSHVCEKRSNIKTIFLRTNLVEENVKGHNIKTIFLLTNLVWVNCVSGWSFLLTY